MVKMAHAMTACFIFGLFPVSSAYPVNIGLIKLIPLSR